MNKLALLPALLAAQVDAAQIGPTPAETSWSQEPLAAVDAFSAQYQDFISDSEYYSDTAMPSDLPAQSFYEAEGAAATPKGQEDIQAKSMAEWVRRIPLRNWVGIITGMTLFGIGTFISRRDRKRQIDE